MRIISKEVSVLLSNIDAIASYGAYLYVASNAENKIVKFSSTLEVLESFSAVSYASYMQCTAMGCDADYLYLAMENGEIYRKSLTTKETEYLFTYPNVTALEVQNNKIILYSQFNNKMYVLTKTGTVLEEASLPCSLQGLAYNSNEEIYYSVDSVTGDLVHISIGSSSIRITEREEGLEPFSMGYYKGDITYFNSVLLSIRDNKILTHTEAPYVLLLKDGSNWYQVNTFNLLSIPLGTDKIYEAQIGNTSDNDFTNLILQLQIPSTDIVGGYLQISKNGDTYSDYVGYTELTSGDTATFYLKVSAPKDGLVAETNVGINITFD